MRVIKFNSDYESITANKEYEILPKSCTDGIYEFLYFVDNDEEIMEIKQIYNAPANDFYEVITIED